MDTTWTKYVKILESGDHVICFNVSQGSTVSFSLEEFPNLVPMLRLRIWAQRNRGLLFGQRSQHNLGLPGGETELGDLKSFLTQQIFFPRICAHYTSHEAGRKPKIYVKSLGEQSGYSLTLLGAELPKYPGYQPKSLKAHATWTEIRDGWSATKTAT